MVVFSQLDTVTIWLVSPSSYGIVDTRGNGGLPGVHGMLPSGVALVLGSLQVIPESNPRMMGGLLVIARLVMLGGFAMVLGCLLIVLRRMFVMLMNLVL